LLSERKWYTAITFPYKTAKGVIESPVKNFLVGKIRDNQFGVSFPIALSHTNQMGSGPFHRVVLCACYCILLYTLFVILNKETIRIQKGFINNMTHEFKTPIATICGITDVLKDPEIVHQPERLFNLYDDYREGLNAVRNKSSVESYVLFKWQG
jgi:hypothetical protein